MNLPESDYSNNIVSGLVADIRIPKMFAVRQTFPRPQIPKLEIEQHIYSLMKAQPFRAKIKPGMRIAITAGSRGVANIALILRSIAAFVRDCEAQPFIVPAMGSHGGATAEGQLEVLRGLGVTPQTVGCPIVSSMETVRVGTTGEGFSVFADKNACEADGIILACRIKPHTAFRGPYESGIMKMMAIGLGKQRGAEICHQDGFKNMAKNVPAFGKVILDNTNILFAVAAIENAYDETAKIVAVDACDIERDEPALLKEAFSFMPRILVDSCDVLVVDRIGKNYSGDGMDPNITGTFCSPYATGGIDAQRVAVLDLSDETHGNAIGLGYASATTKRVIDKIDLLSMYPNAVTCTVLGGVRIPMIMPNDKQTIQVCIKTCNETDITNANVVRIPNSLQLERILLSESYFEKVKTIPGITIESEPAYMQFNEKENLW